MFYYYPFINADEFLKLSVWKKGTPMIGEFDENGNPFSPSEWRRDMCGTIMWYFAHGDRNSDFGWEIDHVLPQSMGGSDNLTNLQPLNWMNNARKGDSFPWTC